MHPSLFIGAYPARHNARASVNGGSHEEWKTEPGIPDSRIRSDGSSQPSSDVGCRVPIDVKQS